MKIYLNENINMEIIRYFSNKYPFISSFIYKNFAFELKKINLQELSFDYNLSKEERDFTQFKKEMFSQILIIALGKIDRKVYS